MTVTIHLYTQSQPIIHEFVVNTYQKGDLFCVLLDDGEVQKFPLQHVFRIVERNSK